MIPPIEPRKPNRWPFDPPTRRRSRDPFAMPSARVVALILTGIGWGLLLWLCMIGEQWR